jgi:hypothetical protein
VVVQAPETAKRFTISAGVGTNLARINDTGVPDLALGVALNPRFELGLDVTLVAYAVMPSVRVKLVGDRTSLHLIGAVPIAFTDGAMSETFVAGAAGLGVRAMVTPSIGLHAEAYGSFATKGHGVTFPAFIGGEVWF